MKVITPINVLQNAAAGAHLKPDPAAKSYVEIMNSIRKSSGFKKLGKKFHDCILDEMESVMENTLPTIATLQSQPYNGDGNILNLKMPLKTRYYSH